MKLTRPIAAIALALPGLFAAAGPAHASGEATLSVLHAIPGAPVDVYVNGSELLKNFTPGTLTKPMMLPSVTYHLKVVTAGAGANGTAVVEATGVTVPAGANITVVAHLSASGAPMPTPFANDTSASSKGARLTSSKGARLTVRHVVAAPAVDVRANRSVVFSNLVNPREATADLAPATVSADVVLHGTSTQVIDPASLKIESGMNTIVCAWGSAQDTNLMLAAQTVALQDGAIRATGDHGTPVAASSASSDTALYVAGGLLVLAGIVFGSSRLARRRA